ncbi:MAG: hypothetical protein LBD11_08445 [Candidatus Peribacteria bacterium]|jgi:hypothetical protein|nr:hypothetical protein [Candidatus Peribacteria bacterium]
MTIKLEELTQEQLDELEAKASNAEKFSADAEKRKGRFKATKAQIKSAKVSKPESEDDDDDEEDTTTPTTDDDLEFRLEAKLEFYHSNPKAKEFKEDIEGYVNKGLNRDEAMKLVFANKDPELLRDPALVNQDSAGITAMQ